VNVADESLFKRHRLTVDDYHGMVDAGLLSPDARVELIDGEIIDMPPMKSRHASAIALLNRELVRAVGDAGLVTCQTPLRLDDYSEPEPDFMVLRSKSDGYREALPTAADVLLLVEVSDTTAGYDRKIKVPLYARHGVAECWIVDLDAGAVRTFRRPGARGYEEAVTLPEAPEALAIAALPGVAVDLRAIPLR
jgi:Uma2 family endonuclease